MKYYAIGEFAELIGKTEQTLRNWDKNGTLKPHHVAESGHRYYSVEQANHFLGLKNSGKKLNRKVVGYCRVSSAKQKDDLERQIENVKSYMITNSEVEKVVVLYKDRLLRFGFEIIENICNNYGTVIEIIDNTEGTEEQELLEDLVQIITVFSCRLQGKRANKAKKIIKELLEDDKDNQSYAST
ncbi:MAG: IS607 family transposase [Bacillota bacterium]|nr:IS607 family transposase [Bacillota bacterium]